MSDLRYETCEAYGAYENHEAYEPYGPYNPYEQYSLSEGYGGHEGYGGRHNPYDPYNPYQQVGGLYEQYDPYWQHEQAGVHDDVHTAQTLPYGPQGSPYADTYRPAYEAVGRSGAHEPTQLVMPRQTRPAGSGTGSGTGGGGTHRGQRRRRARYAERPDCVRRLLPRALVVAFLAGGTTAFVATDKAIELSVDGTGRTLHTFADDVSGLLADEGVRLGPHDVVVPGAEAALTSGDEITVRRGRPVRLTLDGQRREVWTTARTVEEALGQLGVRAEGAHLSVARSQPIGRAGLALDVRTERSVTVMADGRARTVRTNAATVRDVVREAGITLRGQDTTSVAPSSFPRDGQTVTVLRITGSREVREEPVPFAVRRTADPALFTGTEVVERAGQPGVRRIVYSVRTVNGVRQRPWRVESEVVRAPRTQIVKVGTRAHPRSVRGADHLDWQGLAQCESGGRADAVDPSGTYGGLYQFDEGTWHRLGGRGRPQDAPAEEQTYRAKKLYVSRGSSPWPHCGDRLQG
ncbi:ubiquitin-like domain-containing protein [Streptomyces sp. NBC_01788]|uniref:ubiquitin-like domain-containing protein n=1 Tax=Streptomyces sp. NBC_01788 TaxID=2975940 RepID=UPI002DD92720|nr:ubiquitin-like domain-containing protein [Streptomyces sp. NBC_01788]WSB27179.1 ubiquitin-like domain-containing protein [Streptomyces sp. NBC_01788]